MAAVPELSAQGLSFLLDAAVKATVLLVAAGLLSLVLRRQSAALRHLVWLVALTGVVLMPVLTLVLPGLSVPVGALLPSQVATAGKAEVFTVRPTQAAERKSPQPRSSAPAAPVSVQQKPLLDAETPVVMPPAAVIDRAEPLPWSAWVLIAWLAGAAAVAAYLTVGTAGVWMIVRRARRVEGGPWGELMESLCRELGLARPVRLAVSEQAIIPVAWGLARPVVLIPRAAEKWPEDRRRIVLLHELAHVRRRDCLTQTLALAACVLYWFNPLAWLAARRLRIEREGACDDLVLAAGSPAADYAGHLLEIVRTLRSQRCPSLAAVAMARRSQFEGRMLAILDGNRNRRALTRWGALAAAILVAGIVVPLACLKATGDRPASAPESPAAPAGEQQDAKANLINWVEDFFSKNYRDITARKALEWGQPLREPSGNLSIRYKYLATIWDKDKFVIEEQYTFSPDGKFISVKSLSRVPAAQEAPASPVKGEEPLPATQATSTRPVSDAEKAELMNWVEDFFSKNYRDITARKTLEWGQPQREPSGNLSIRYKFLATIWDKDKLLIEKRFTFTPQGKFISAETLETGPAAPPAALKGEENPKWREVLIPGAGTKGVPVILHLASGKMLVPPDGKGNEPSSYFTRLGQGDVGFDRVIFILRGGRLTSPDGRALAPKETKEDASAYELATLPEEMVVKTADGAAFRLRVVTVTSEGGLRIRYAPTAAPKAAAYEFGPVIERTVLDQPSGEDVAIGLKAGKLVSLPRDVLRQGPEAAQGWCRRNGLDAMAVTQDPVRGLLGLDLKLVVAEARAWEAAGLGEVDALRLGPAGALVYLSAKGNLPETFYFQTREGATGVLQIVGFTDNPKGVKIRYKLVQQAVAAPPSEAEKAAAPAGGQQDPKANLMNWVEDYFRHNNRGISARQTLEWGEVQKEQNGNLSIRYKFLATISIWDKELVIEEQYTFSPDGKFVSLTKLSQSVAPAAPPTAAKADAAGWSEGAQGLRARLLVPEKPLIAGEAGEVVVEVENASDKPLLWRYQDPLVSIAGAGAWGLPQRDRVELGKGARSATADEVSHEFPGIQHPDLTGNMPFPGIYRLEPGGRLRALVPAKIEKPGRYHVEAKLFRIQTGGSLVRKDIMECPPIDLPVVAAGQAAPSASVVTQAFSARLARLDNLIARYDVTERFFLPPEYLEKAVANVGQMRHVLETGTKESQRVFSYLGGNSRYDIHYTSIKRQVDPGPKFVEIMTECLTFGKERAENLALDGNGRPLRVRIRQRGPLPPPDIETALGMRTLRDADRLDADAIKAMTVEMAGDTQAILRRTDANKVAHEWVLDPKIGYAVVTYRIRVPPDGFVNLEMLMSDFRNVNGIALPYAATRRGIINKRNDIETVTHTTTIKVSEYKLDDPNNKSEGYSITWPEGAMVTDERSGVHFLIRNGAMTPIDAGNQGTRN